MGKFNSNLIDRNTVYKRLPDRDGVPVYTQQLRRTIVCLCGSTRFADAFRHANEQETLAGRIVLSVGCFRRTAPDGEREPLEEATKQSLDELHLDKIDLADEVLVLNVNGYIGDSTRREVLHAHRAGKTIRWLLPFDVPKDFNHIGNSLSGPSKSQEDDPDYVGA